MSFAIHLLSGHWSRLQLAANESGSHMLALATYLGHVNIDATNWYLESTPELMGEIAVIAESFMQRGRP